MGDNKIKVVVERDGKVISERTISLKEINLTARCQINDLLFEHIESPNKNFFSRCVKMIQAATDYSDAEINAFSNEEIYQLFTKITEFMNKKK